MYLMYQCCDGKFQKLLDRKKIHPQFDLLGVNVMFVNNSRTFKNQAKPCIFLNEAP